MKQLYLLLLLSFFNAALGQSHISGKRVIVKLKIDQPYHGTYEKQFGFTGNYKIDSISRLYNGRKIQSILQGRNSHQYLYVIQFDSSVNISLVIKAYYQTNEIEYAEPDYIGYAGGMHATVTPDDKYYSRQWGLKNDGTFPLTTAVEGVDINMEAAWGIEQGDSNVIVAIIDTGNKMNHREFERRIWFNDKDIKDNGIDDDSNGFTDDYQGWDFANSDNDPSDDNGHGVNVTGIIGANGNNGIGYAGVDWHCKLMAIKALSSNGYGYNSWFCEAIYYAVDNGAKVINMSLGGATESLTMQDAVNYAYDKNVTIVACMMNTDTSITYYPAGCTGVLAVGAISPNGNRASPFFWSATSGSNYGKHISVVAPGNYVYGLRYQNDTNYGAYWGGTSQATPYVAGLVALLLAQNPDRTPAQIKKIIESTADDQTGNASEDKKGWDQYYGFGRINAFKALSNQNTTAVDNVKGNNTVTVFPNPATQMITVKSEQPITEIRLYNAFGQLVSVENGEGELTQQLAIAGNGIYFIRIICEHQTLTQKIIVNE